MTVMCFFAFAYTPLISYVTARLEGLAGQVVEIPMVREAAFILFRIPRRRRRVVPADSAGKLRPSDGLLPTGGTDRHAVLVDLEGDDLPDPADPPFASVLFANFIWSLSEIPGPQYPYADMMWELNAANQSLIYSSTLGRFSTFEQAFNWHYLASGVGFGVVLFSVMSFLSAPIMMTYGVVRGLNQTMPHTIIPQFIGALIGRYYFERRIGVKWRQYAPVIARRLRLRRRAHHDLRCRHRLPRQERDQDIVLG